MVRPNRDRDATEDANGTRDGTRPNPVRTHGTPEEASRIAGDDLLEELAKLNEKELAKIDGQAIANTLVLSVMSAFYKANDATDRAEQQQRHLLVAFALAACTKRGVTRPGSFNSCQSISRPCPTTSIRARGWTFGPMRKASCCTVLASTVSMTAAADWGDRTAGDDLSVPLPLPEAKKKWTMGLLANQMAKVGSPPHPARKAGPTSPPRAGERCGLPVFSPAARAGVLTPLPRSGGRGRRVFEPDLAGALPITVS